MSRSKDIGTMAESAVAKFLQENGWPHAERRALHGAVDLGDITGTPGVAWEVKGGKAAEGASDGQVQKWLDETEVERVNAKADFGVLVMKRKGIGYPRAGEWWAVLPYYRFTDLAAEDGATYIQDGSRIPVRVHLFTMARLLRAVGYGGSL